MRQGVSVRSWFQRGRKSTQGAWRYSLQEAAGTPELADREKGWSYSNLADSRRGPGAGAQATEVGMQDAGSFAGVP